MTDQVDLKPPNLCQGDGRCFYCDNVLHPKQHEHDHFPVADRHGGKQVICCCVNCHAMKDRLPLDRWSELAIEDMFPFPRLSALQRIFLAKCVTIAQDSVHELNRVTHELEEYRRIYGPLKGRIR